MSVYDWRGCRMLDKKCWSGKCKTCKWACVANVTIEYNWGVTQKFRFESFCYGPKSCKNYKMPRQQIYDMPFGKVYDCLVAKAERKGRTRDEVDGILRSGGNYHCYNVIGDCVFDLTSEQFGDEVLSYENNPIQSREVHFAKEEKRLRYEYLKEALKKSICGR